MKVACVSEQLNGLNSRNNYYSLEDKVQLCLFNNEISLLYSGCDNGTKQVLKTVGEKHIKNEIWINKRELKKK